MAPRNNPYHTDSPIRHVKNFFGREKELKGIVQTLQKPSIRSLILFGPCYIGKTSLLWRLQQTLSTREFLPVYLDLWDWANRPLRELLTHLAETTLRQLYLFKQVEPKLDNLSQLDTPELFCNRFLSPLYDNLKKVGLRPVFLLDEFHEQEPANQSGQTNTLAGETFFSFMSEVIQLNPNSTFIFALNQRTRDKSAKVAGLLKVSLEKEIWGLDSQSTKDLIHQLDTLSFDPKAITYISNITYGHPYLIQLICSQIWEAIYAEAATLSPSSSVSKSEVEAAIAKLLSTDELLRWLWQDLKPVEKLYTVALTEIDRRKRVLQDKQIIKAIKPYALQMGRQNLKVELRNLVKRRLLRRLDQQNYCLAVEPLHLWIEKYKSLPVVRNEFDRFETASSLFTCGDEFFKQGKWIEAKVCLKEVLEKYPYHFSACLYLGRTLLALNQLDEAVIHLKTAYEIDKRATHSYLVEALMALAQLRRKAKNEAEALKICDEIFHISPREAEAQKLWRDIWTQRGDRALKQQDWEAALNAYDMADDHQAFVEIENKLGEKARVYEQQGIWLKAAIMYEWLANTSQNRDKWTNKRKQALQENNLANRFDESMTALHQAKWDIAFNILRGIKNERQNYEKDGRAVTTLLKQCRQKLRILGQHSKKINDIAFSKDGRKLASVSEDGYIYVWGVTDGILRFSKELIHPIKSITFASDTILIVGTLSESVYLWHLNQNNSDLYELKVPQGPVNSLTFSSDEKLLACGTGAHKLYLGSIKKKSLSIEVQKHDEPITCVTFSSDGKLLASGGRDKQVCIWKVVNEKLELLSSQHHSMDWISDVAFSPDTQILAWSSWDGKIYLWEICSGKPPRVLERPLENKDNLSPPPVMSIAFSPNGKWLVSGSRDKTVCLWRLNDDKLEKKLEGTLGIVNNVAISPTGLIALTSDNEHGSGNCSTIYIWHPDVD